MRIEQRADCLQDAAGDDFDRHVVLSILTIALTEAEGEGCSVCRQLGLDAAELLDLAAAMVPEAIAELSCRMAAAERLESDEEEQSLRDLLVMFSTDGSWLQRHLAAMIARRCKQPHHLWQDLGLNNRGELSLLMSRHFAGLAARNRNDMKWKKFLYRMVCRSEGFSLCLSPVCSECDDFANCFGAEDGESLLARLRNGQELRV